MALDKTKLKKHCNERHQLENHRTVSGREKLPFEGKGSTLLHASEQLLSG